MPAWENMATGSGPIISFVFATRNRRALVAETLERIHGCGLSRDDFEVIAVDNASSDGTIDLLASRVDCLVRQPNNAGSCAKAHAIDQVRAPFIIFLDDDAAPREGAAARMVDKFTADPQLAAAGFSVCLPDGTPESSALPGVFHGCCVGLRAAALRAVGNLDHTFFMQAEEYDLSFRLVNAGWAVRVFDDLEADHRKSSTSRSNGTITFCDTRNNLRLVSRYLPAPYASVYRKDWLWRYGWLARRQGRTMFFLRGALAGMAAGIKERRSYAHRRLKSGALEHFFRWGYVGAQMANLARAGVRRLLFADLGKNIYAFYRAALKAGVEVVAVADDRFADDRRSYRNIPIVPYEEALRMAVDGIVISNMAAPFAQLRRQRLRQLTNRPIHNWFESELSAPIRSHSEFACRRLPNQVDSSPQTVFA